jgi:shikimate kinase
MTTFIKKKVDVEDAGASMTFKSGQFSKSRFSLETRNIYLVGMRGSGKTTLGQALAAALDCAFVDTDAVLVRDAGQTIDEIVTAHGWDHFRTLEEQTLAKVCGMPGKVVATGGGIILSAANRELMGKTGVSFYLAADAALLTGRILRDANPAQRPALTGLALHDEVAQVMSEREPLYMASMDHMLQANRGVDELVDDVLVDLGLKEWDYSEKVRLMDRY